MIQSMSCLELIAASRTDPALVRLLASLGLGVFVAALTVGLLYLGARKRGEAINRSFYQKLALYGVCGLVCGYFSMRITIKNNPELFGGKNPLSDPQIRAILEDPIPRMPEPNIEIQLPPEQRRLLGAAKRTPEQEAESRRDAERRREEQEARTQQQREEHERQVRQLKEEHEARVAKMRKDREERSARQAEERKIAQAAEADRKQQELNDLLSLSLEELEKVREERNKEKNEATEQMKALNAKGSGATPEQRQAASKRFSAAVKAYMASSKALMEKRRQQRELNR
jgi:hypothetical protein